MSNNTLFFIGSYKHKMHYTDGGDVYELEDYRAGFNPTFTKQSEETWEDKLSWIDEVVKLTEEQKLRYDSKYADLPKLVLMYYATLPRRLGIR